VIILNGDEPSSSDGMIVSIVTKKILKTISVIKGSQLFSYCALTIRLYDFWHLNQM